MANLRADNLTGTGGRNAMKGSVFFSGYVDGTSADWLQIHDNLDDMDVGSGDFTFECWVKAAESSGEYAGIFGMYNYDNAGLLIQLSNAGVIRLVNPGSIDQSGSTVIIPQDGSMGDWHHIAVARSGSTLKAFVNGNEEISHSYSSAIDFANGDSAVIGITDRNDYPGDYDLRGYISNLRLIKGTALYTSAFTPSTEELTAIDGTVLLCCQDTDDPTAEATGRHEIVGFRKCYQGKRYSNIATNGDLETGDTTGWTNSGCATFEVTTGNSHSGSYSLHCISDGNGDGVSFPITLNTTLRYKISAYMKCVGPVGTSAKAKMKVGSAFGDSTNYESQTVGYDSYKTFDKWDYVEWIGRPTSAATVISFVESSANNVNDWYVDDLRVEVWFPEESENILANPDFLTGATGWSFSSTPSGEYTISSNRLNIADTSRTNDAYATQQLYSYSMAEGRYRFTIDYTLTGGAFDPGVGNSRIWGVGNSVASATVTHEVVADNNNSNFRLVANQHCVGYFTSVTLYRVAEPKRINPVPPYGIDAGLTFEGETKHNTQSYMYFPTGDTSQSNRGRCIVSNGAPGNQALQYLQMQSGGIMQSFGNLANSAALSSGCGSSTRMLVADGYISPASTNIIEYLTIATTSNGTDYGDLTAARRRPIGMSNTTRGVWATGSHTSPTPYLNTIDYNTIASLGNATDFGDASANASHGGGVSSSTRGIYSLGYEAPAVVNTLEYITFATTGNAVNFGDLNAAKSYHFRGCSSSDSTRGLFAGGYTPSNNTIDYITMASTGDATDFGDLTVARRSGMATGNSIDAIFVGGYIPGVNNTIDKVTIQTTGNAVDWGDQTGTAYHEGACSSDSHGGLS